jgi:hypothetical protein
MGELITGQGFRVNRDADLFSVANDLQVPVRHRRSLLSGRVAVADRQGAQ